VIAQRLDRISKQERSLLQIASALGPRSTEAMLRKVAALPEAALRECLAALDRAELLVNVDSALDRLFEFRHEMVRQVTYDSMVEKVRESIHARIVSTLEKDDNFNDLPDMLCHHAIRAKDWRKAFVYGRSSARKSIDRSAFAEAITYFETAMNALDRTPGTPSREAEAVDIRIEARTAFMGGGQVAEWFELGKDAERRASLIDDIGRRVAAMTVRAGAQNFYGTPVESVIIGETVVRLAEEWGNSGWLNLAQYGLGQAYFLAGRYREAEQMLGQACARLTGPDASAPIGTKPQYLLLLCCMMKTIAHATLGEIDVADQFQQRAAAIANESNRPFDRVAASYSGGWLMLDRGRPEEAAAILEDGLRVAQTHGVRLFQPVIKCHLGMAYLAAGLLGRARSVLAEAREEAKSVGYTSSILRASIHLAVALNRLGEEQAARNLLRETRNTARQQGFSGLEAETLVAEAMVTPKSNENNRAFVLHALRTAIAAATESEAKPLKRRAEALLNEMLSQMT
jgi:tetratricopeptide (TPR) repeat protein